MVDTLRRFWRDERGQDLIEYSLLITFIAIACMWFVGAGRDPIGNVWQTSNNHLSTAASTSSS